MRNAECGLRNESDFEFRNANFEFASRLCATKSDRVHSYVRTVVRCSRIACKHASQ